MAEIVNSIPGSVIKELCVKLGADPKDVSRIIITPRGARLELYTFRHNEDGKLFIVDGDAARQITDVLIRWSE